jgi:hypothetical protein
MLTYRNLKKENISAIKLICLTDALLVKAENRTLQEMNLLIEKEDVGEVTSHQFLPSMCQQLLWHN